MTKKMNKDDFDKLREEIRGDIKRAITLFTLFLSIISIILATFSFWTIKNSVNISETTSQCNQNTKSIEIIKTSVPEKQQFNRVILSIDLQIRYLSAFYLGNKSEMNRVNQQYEELRRQILEDGYNIVTRGGGL